MGNSIIPTDPISTQFFPLFAQLMLMVFTWIYVVFSFLIIKQVNLMNRSLKTAFSPLFSVVAKIHLAIALGFAAIATTLSIINLMGFLR